MPTEPSNQQQLTEPVTFDSAWKMLIEGMQIVFKRKNMTPKYYMNLYQAVYLYCTSVTAVTTAMITADAEAKKREAEATKKALETNATATEAEKKAADARASIEIPEKMTPQSAQQFIGRELYSALQNFIDECAKEFTDACVDLSGEDLLKYYCDEWDNFRFSAKVLDGIYGYLNRHWIRRELDEGGVNVFMVYSLGLQQFKTTVFDKLEQKVRGAVLELIRKERTGDSINGRYISTVVESFIAIGLDKVESLTKGSAPLAQPLHIYKDSFEAQFLEETKAFYSNEVRQFMMDGGDQPDCKEYMKKVWQRIQQEENRVNLLMNSTTMKGLQDVVNEVMITSQLEFIQSHFGPLLMEKADLDLKRMYDLCSRVPSGLDALRRALQAHVTKEGHAALEQRVQEAFQDPKIYVNTILEVHERYQGLVDASFQKEPGFMKSLDSAAIAFINMNAVVKKAPTNQHGLKSAELIARYCDGLMRKNSKMPDEMEMEDLQKRVITIFKYLEDKDVFLKFYTKNFCKRLINELSASDEAENTFIAKLTDCCGFEFTSRLMKMTQDCQVSKDLTVGYKETATGDAKKMEFAVQVLSTGTWPSFPQTSLTLPMNLLTTIEGFTNFYNEKYTGRRLQWVYAQCRGELSSNAFGKGRKYIFGVTTTQMCTLLLFNEQTSYVAEQIMSGTGMDTKTTSAVVGSLVKNQVLTSDQPLGEQAEVPLNAVITLNTAYANKKVRVDLSKMTMAVQVAKDSEQVQKGLDADRNNIISACIVRIMKARKSLSHQHLMTEVITQLNSRFKPKVEMIKRCIGMLIEKEYMKRSDEQRDHYDYMA